MEQQHSRLAPISRSIFSTLTAAIISMPLYATAADFGVLKGTITDRNDGEPVIGASVMLENTTIGAASDFDGNYSIMEIPAGTYSLKVSGVGYAPLVQKVTVPAGETATLNLKLAETTIMASEVVVGAALYEQDRLDVPITASVVSEDEIKEEPNPSLDQVIETVPGVNVTRSAGYSASSVQIRGSNTYQGGGIGTRVNAFYDGFPINTPETGGIVWTNINMNSADKVEVIKGASSTLYGSGAMGGVVNVFGHLPDKFEVKSGISGGFYDSTPDSDQSTYTDGYTPWLWSTYIGIGDKQGPINYSLLYTHSEDDGYRENSQTEMDDIKLKARYDIDSRQYLQITSSYNETNAGYVSTWPYDLVSLGPTGAVYDPHPEKAYDLADDVYTDDTVKRKDILIGFNYVNLLSDDLSLDTRVYYTRNEYRINYNPTDALQEYMTLDMLESNTSLQASAQAAAVYTGTSIAPDIWEAMGPGQAAYSFNYDTFLTDYLYGSGNFVNSFVDDFNAQLTGFPYSREPGEFNENKTDRYGAGMKFDWQANDSHRLLFGFDGNIIDVASTQYRADLPVPGDLGEVQEKNIALFIQDEYKMTDRLTALLSVRYDWSGIDTDAVSYYDYSENPMDPSSASEVTEEIANESVDAISPRLALNYRASDDLSFRASVGKSFRAPTLSERFVRDAGLFMGNPNPELDKETMTGYEVGVFKNFSDNVSLDVAGYINDYDDLIESRNLNPLGFPIVFMYENVAKARIWGIETSLNIRPSNALHFGIGYSYMNAKDETDRGASLAGAQNPDPEWLAYRPEHSGSLSATWKATKRLTLNTNGRYIGTYKAVSSYPNPEGTNYPGDFIVFNAGAKYKFTDFMSGSFLCKNITNEQYEEAEWFRAPGRSYVFGMDFVF